MSNILNLKGVKVLAIIMLAVAILATFGMVATTASAQQPAVSVSDIQYAATVRQGSSGQAALIWQKFLNDYSSANLVADGNFGPLTAAAAKIWQASRSLAADGVLGAMSRASAINQINAGITNPMGGTYPAGCSSFSGYSVTTGFSCASSYPAGCTSTNGYSVTTGMSCAGTPNNLPAGCTSTAGFSPSTGASCSGGSTPSTSGPLSGGAGSITLTAKSTYSNEDVLAGDEDVPVLAFEVEADDESDVEITSAKVEFINSNGASSRRLRDYAESVSIFMDGDKVGEADADDFSESSNFYSKTISLDGAIVRAGDTEKFYVAVTALSNLDSGDIDTDSWSVDLLSVRFEDGEGVVTTETANAAGSDTAAGFQRDLDFEDLSTSGDLELKLALGSNSPDGGSVEVDSTTTTDVTMLEFTIKAEGSDMYIDALELTATSTGVDTTFADMVSEFSLEADGDDLDSVSAFADATDDNTGELWFTDLDFTIDEGDTVTFRVVAKIRSATTGASATVFDQGGDTLVVSFPNASLDDTTNTDVEDENGDTVIAGDRTGSATGVALAFYTSGVDVDMGNVTYSVVTDGANTEQVTYTIPLAVTAFGDTRFLGQSGDYEAVHTDITDDMAFSFAMQASTAATTDIVTPTVTHTFSCSATIEGSGFRLDEGVTKNCTLTVIMTAPAVASTSYRVHVEGVQSYLDSALTNDATNELIQLLAPADEFQTDYKFITS